MNVIRHLLSRFGLSLCIVASLTGYTSAQAPVVPPTVVDAPLPASAATLLSSNPSSGSANRGGVIAGAGFYLVQPYFQNNPAYTVFSQTTFDATLDATNPNTQTLAESSRRVNVKHNLSFAPLMWLGYVNEEGFGARIRYWGLQQGTSQTVVLPPFAGAFNINTGGGETIIVASGTLNTVSSAAPLGLQAFGDTLGIQHGPETTAFNVTTKLAMHVGDLELIQNFQNEAWSFLVTGGLRYVSIDQTYNAYDAQSGSPAALRSLLSTNQFQGLGPTLAVEFHRPLGDCGIGVYGSCRGSMVFGSASQNAVFFGQELRNDDPNPQYASQQRNRGIPIVDFEIGTEYRCDVGCNSLFGQVGLIGQQWYNAGSASRSATMNPAGTLRPVLGGATLDSNLALLGLSFRVGLNY